MPEPPTRERRITGHDDGDNSDDLMPKMEML
jgi:hypothetical protein